MNDLEAFIRETFPRQYYPRQTNNEYPDFTKLAPNDPLFLDMGWPTEKGPESAAFARHIQWRRRLSDHESNYFLFSSHELNSFFLLLFLSQENDGKNGQYINVSVYLIYSVIVWMIISFKI